MTEFEQFYENVFKPNLAALDTYPSGPLYSSGHTINGSSWDRKAAYLLFMFVQGLPAPTTTPPVDPEYNPVRRQ